MRLAAAAHTQRSPTELPPRVTFKPFAETVTVDLGSGDEAPPAPVNLSPVLRAIAAAAKIGVAGEKAGIMARFALMMAGAKATASPDQLPGILRALKDQRRAALAIASRNQSRKSHEERQQVLQGRPARRSRTGRRTRAPKNRHS